MKILQRLTIKAIAPVALLLGVWAGPAGAGFEGQNYTFYGLDAGSSTTNVGGSGAFFGSGTFVGSSAGKSNTNSFRNTFIGYAAGYDNTTGDGNTFLGHQTGVNSTTGNDNTFLGNFAGVNSTTGSGNTFLGSKAGYNTTGTGNVFLGHEAGYNETGSNKLYIANSRTSTPLLYGHFGGFQDGSQYGIVPNLTVNGKLGVQVTSPTFPLQMASGAHVTSGGVWTNASSRAYKEQIVALNGDEAMAAVKALTPVTFRYLTEQVQHVGFIAEDVPALVATPDRKSVSSMDVVAVLTRAVQEQQKLIEEQQQVLADLTAEVKALRASEDNGSRLKTVSLSR